MIGFYEDPENYPLQTPTGKLEFYSQRLAEHFPDDQERPPVPRFIPYGESHQESLLHPRAENFQLLIVSNHPRWRVHSQHDDMTWLREISTCKVTGPDGYYYEPLWMNAVDVEKRGIRHGDVATVFNERGAVLGGVYITERVMPGVVYMDHGARYDPIVPGELDRGWKETRCVDVCPTDALIFWDEEDLNNLIGRSETLRPELNTKPRVYYRGLPQKFIAGAVYDPAQDECIEGAAATLQNLQSGERGTTATDEFGDFWFEDLKLGNYALSIEKEGYKPHRIKFISTNKDMNLGDIALLP